jgi:hypothetical protein
MTFLGRIACPDCDLPLSSDQSVCPYCFSRAPATAPWQGWGSRWEIQAVVVGAIIVCVLCDLFLDTRILPTIASWLKSK